MTNKYCFILLVFSVLIFLSGCSKVQSETTAPPAERASKMVAEAERYLNYKASHYWCVRTSSNDVIGLINSEGMPYSYGNKDTPEHFSMKLDFDAISLEAHWGRDYAQNWYEYCDCPFLVGLTYDEWSAGSPLASWAGIDCSGLVQRCAYAGGFRFYGVAYEGNIGNDWFNRFEGAINSQNFNNYFTKNVADDSDYKDNITSIASGDVVIYPPPYEHVAIVSTIDSSGETVSVINALGSFVKGYKIIKCNIELPANKFAIYRWPNN